MSDDFDFPEVEPKTSAKKGRNVPEQKAEAEADTKSAPAGSTVNILDGGSPEYSDTELEQVFDDLMFSNGYTEEIKIGRRMTISLKTRSGKDAREVMMRLDKAGYSLGLTVESIRSLYNLVQSVVLVNGKDISGETFEKKLEMIEDMPTPVISAMIVALVKFDRKVEAAVKHGEENF